MEAISSPEFNNASNVNPCDFKKETRKSVAVRVLSPLPGTMGSSSVMDVSGDKPQKTKVFDSTVFQQ
jgi:hypothetical protein